MAGNNNWKEGLQDQISRVRSATDQQVSNLIASGASTKVIADAQQSGREQVNSILKTYNSAENVSSRQRIVSSNPSTAWAPDAGGLARLNSHGAVVGTMADSSTQDKPVKINPYTANNPALALNTGLNGLTLVSANKNSVAKAVTPAVLRSDPPAAINVEDRPVDTTVGTKGTQTHPNIYKPPGITDYQSGKRPKPFGWLEEYIDPTMFASSDACLLTIGCSKKEFNEDGSMGKILGFCDNVSFNLSQTNITLKELRAERTILIQGKAAPGQLSMSRLICKGDSVTNFLGIISKEEDKRLRYDNQLRIAKKPFGIGVVMFSTIGNKELTTFYIEQCVINSISVPIQSRTYSLYENISISFNRIVDL